jgi:hypothetical protein
LLAKFKIRQNAPKQSCEGDAKTQKIMFETQTKTKTKTKTKTNNEQLSSRNEPRCWRAEKEEQTLMQQCQLFGPLTILFSVPFRHWMRELSRIHLQRQRQRRRRRQRRCIILNRKDIVAESFLKRA